MSTLVVVEHLGVFDDRRLGIGTAGEVGVVYLLFLQRGKGARAKRRSVSTPWLLYGSQILTVSSFA